MMHTVHFATWSDFKGGFRVNLPGNSDYNNYKRFIFRGQGDSRWQLKSTFDRQYGDKLAGRRDKLAKELIYEFYEECARQSEWRYDESDHRVLAMAQHYGLPTRLLDWSFSPYVAAYFAFSWFLFEQVFDPSRNVAIWAINREDLVASVSTGQLEVIYVQDHENARMGSQYGLFTYLKTNDTALEDYLISADVGLSNCIVKFELPGTEVRAALEDLIFMGIHHGTIFPGREGIAHTIRLRRLLTV